MSISNFLRKKAASSLKKIIFPEFEDERILKATLYIKEHKIACPVLLTDKYIDGVDTINIQDNKIKAKAIEYLIKEKGISEEDASSALNDRITFATVLLHLGYADCMVAGANTTTAQTLRPSLWLRKLYPGAMPVTSCFFMEVELNGEKKVLIFSDCALNPEPTPAMLAQIARSAAYASKHILGVEPYVAMLSFSTKGSADTPSTKKVREAVEIAKRKFNDIIIDGEIQADAALIDWIGVKKAPQSPVAGKANVLIFPDLNSGNIAYKLVERLAGAKAIGPIILGLRPVVNDLSRGCSVDDIIDIAAVAAIQSNIDSHI